MASRKRLCSDLGRVDLDYLLSTLEIYDAALLDPASGGRELAAMRYVLLSEMRELIGLIDQSFPRATSSYESHLIPSH